MKSVSSATRLVAALVLAAASLIGCNTISGAGKDVQAIGRGVTKAADTVKEQF
ncbi:MAG: entericidin EcnA/B family protein [Maricaulaceae bacterium]